MGISKQTLAACLGISVILSSYDFVWNHSVYGYHECSLRDRHSQALGLSRFAALQGLHSLLRSPASPNMAVVTYALKFSITFYVLSILIFIGGIGAYIVMPMDVLPEVNVPVVTIVWTYTGLDTPGMERRATTYTKFALSNNVNGIQQEIP